MHSSSRQGQRVQAPGNLKEAVETACRGLLKGPYLSQGSRIQEQAAAMCQNHLQILLDGGEAAALDPHQEVPHLDKFPQKSAPDCDLLHTYLTSG